MITTLSFYDFDGTLMDTPQKDEGIKYWEAKTGEEYPHQGWWSKPESLDINVFDIKPFQTVLNQFRSDSAKSDTYTILLTSRLMQLRPQIKKILDANGIVFNELSLKGGGGDKDDRVKSFLKKFPDVKTVNIYDDREKEFIVFRRLKNEIGDQYQVNVYRADNGKISLIESSSSVNMIISEELKRFEAENQKK